ncbi:hypothetical protein HJG60_008471 [Phyllostomus discolor]|uniref:Uncharacterized protein n=1 Tax=Phyllostomus discolor TaxID=89673 RepID=A0A833Z521_9CHIR|nr:hypothetical protein HJG60_008471 [Phyllostomus discolor]
MKHSWKWVTFPFFAISCRRERTCGCECVYRRVHRGVSAVGRYGSVPTMTLPSQVLGSVNHRDIFLTATGYFSLSGDHTEWTGESESELWSQGGGDTPHGACTRCPLQSPRLRTARSPFCSSVARTQKVSSLGILPVSWCRIRIPVSLSGNCSPLVVTVIFLVSAGATL